MADLLWLYNSAGNSDAKMKVERLEDKTPNESKSTEAANTNPKNVVTKDNTETLPLSPRAQQLARARARQEAMSSATVKSGMKPLNTGDTSNHKPAARRARPRRRHIGLMVFFTQLVVLPTLIAGWYLYFVALDQYASHLGFSVRKEETSSAIEILGGITELSGSSSSDTDILYEFINSQNMVRAVNDQIDLQEVYRRDGDPVFTLGDDTRIEALSDYWNSMVDVYYDRSSGLIEIRVKAFDPEDARRIAALIYTESSLMINELSAIARADATRYAADELDVALERLKDARAATTSFRTRTQIVDPAADIQGRMGLLNTLQAQLADALIELDLTRQASTRDDDPRVIQGQRRVQVIEDRIESERERFSEGGNNNEDEAYSQLVGEYEALSVDQQFAEAAYIAALGAFNSSSAEAQRQSRYLASYLDPTLAETPEYPRRFVLLATVFSTLLILFSISTMIFYSLRDRR